tara:strand:- start:327 stop:617 length:291 start_codon:yes stop_codon:yes gene_type:complete
MDIEKEARTRTLIELEYKKPNVSEWLLGVFFVDGMLNLPILSLANCATQENMFLATGVSIFFALCVYKYQSNRAKRWDEEYKKIHEKLSEYPDQAV